VESPDYFDVPKSRLEILMEERAEEEALDAERARLASELRNERIQRTLESGRREVQGYDDSDSDDDEGGKRKGDSSKSKRRLSSVFGSAGGKSMLQRKSSSGGRSNNIQNKINAAACGVPLGRDPGEGVPAMPARKQGKLKLERFERAKLNEKPSLAASATSTVKSKGANPGGDLNDIVYQSDRVRKEVLTQFEEREEGGSSDDDESITYSTFAKGYTSRSNVVRTRVEESSTLIDDHEGEDDAEDYRPLSPYKRRPK
jgi:hypothetical protein